MGTTGAGPSRAHRIVAEVLLGLALLGRHDRTRLVLSALLVVALFAQTGLGYVGRETAEAAAWHVPLGVAIFGFTAYLVGRPVAPTATTPAG